MNKNCHYCGIKLKKHRLRLYENFCCKDHKKKFDKKRLKKLPITFKIKDILISTKKYDDIENVINKFMKHINDQHIKNIDEENLPQDKQREWTIEDENEYTEKFITKNYFGDLIIKTIDV